MPAELLLQILSHLATETSQAGLTSISYVNQRLSATTRDLRAQLLRSRLQGISHITILMQIWSPPLFFRHDRGSGQSSGGYVSCPADFHDLLCDAETYNRIDRYLTTLERNNWVAGRISDFVATMVDLPQCRSSGEKRSLLQTAIIELWSAHVRYGHDIDGYMIQIREEYGPEFYIQDSYVQSLPSGLRSVITMVYHALCQYLRHPFYPSASRTEGLWLYKHILRVRLSRYNWNLPHCWLIRRAVWRASWACWSRGLDRKQTSDPHDISIFHTWIGWDSRQKQLFDGSESAQTKWTPRCPEGHGGSYFISSSFHWGVYFNAFLGCGVFIS